MQSSLILIQNNTSSDQFELLKGILLFLEPLDKDSIKIYVNHTETARYQGKMLPLVSYMEELYSEEMFLPIVLAILRERKYENQGQFLVLLQHFYQTIVQELLFSNTYYNDRGLLPAFALFSPLQKIHNSFSTSQARKRYVHYLMRCHPEQFFSREVIAMGFLS